AADLLVELSNAFSQLGSLAGARRSPRLEQFLLAGHRPLSRAVVAPARQLRREHDCGSVITLREQPCLPGHQFIELRAHDAKRRFGYRIVETQHNLSLVNLATFLDEN